MRYKMILLDLDDTLTDNRVSVRHAFGRVMDSLGREYSEEDFERYVEVNDRFWEKRVEARLEKGKKSEDYLIWLRSRRFIDYFGIA